MLGNRTAKILKKRTQRKKVQRLVRVALTLAFIIGFTGVLYYVFHQSVVSRKPDETISQPSGLVPEVRAAIDEGNYEFAMERIGERLEMNPDDNVFQKLQALLMERLEIDLRFNYLPGRRSQITTRSTSAELVLTKNDPYYLVIHSSEKCYLYLCQLQSSGKLVKLFPNSKHVPTSNPVPGGPIRIPDGYDWFYLDDIPGNETIYLVASRWRQNFLEKLFAQLESERDAEKERQIIQKIVSRLEREEQATDNIPGLVSAKYQFRHEKALQ